MTAARLETAKDLAVTLVVATAGGLAFTWAGLPVAWLAGPALFTAALTTLRHRSNQLPRSFRTLAQVAIGVTIGASFPPDAPELLSHHALAIALSLGATLVLGLGAGSILGRWAGLDRPTALLASSPGGASGLVAISN